MMLRKPRRALRRGLLVLSRIDTKRYSGNALVTTPVTQCTCAQNSPWKAALIDTELGGQAVNNLECSLQRRREAVGRMIEFMSTMGFTYIEAYYGEHQTPRTILGSTPDVYATVGVLCRPQAVGVVGTLEELGQTVNMRRLQDLTAWSGAHEPHKAQLYLGVIREPATPGWSPMVSAADVVGQVVTVRNRQLLMGLYCTGWYVVDV